MDDNCACGCGAHIGPAAVSEYFATEGCQRRWNRQKAGLPIREADQSLSAFLDTIRTAAQRRRQQDAPTLRSTWREVGYTIGGGTVYTAPAIETAPETARWWTYDDRLGCWYLMEADGIGTRRIYAVTDETARRAAPTIEDYLRRRFDGHIPPLPTRYID